MWSGADVRTSCKGRKIIKNAAKRRFYHNDILPVKVSFDTAKNKLSISMHFRSEKCVFATEEDRMSNCGASAKARKQRRTRRRRCPCGRLRCSPGRRRLTGAKAEAIDRLPRSRSFRKQPEISNCWQNNKLRYVAKI